MCSWLKRFLLIAASDSATSIGDEISAAVGKLTGEAQTNGQVYVNAVKKAAEKVRISHSGKQICVAKQPITANVKCMTVQACCTACVIKADTAVSCAT